MMLQRTITNKDSYTALRKERAFVEPGLSK